MVLDRDGVLNVEPAEGWVSDRRTWRWEQGARDGLAAFAAAGLAVSVVTNQSGIGRGVVPARAVHELHGWLADRLADLGVDLVGVFVCPHGPDDGCGCRKPEPGLVTSAMRAAGSPGPQTLVVGDAVRDVDAGLAAGCRVALVRTGKGADAARLRPETPAYRDLADVARSHGWSADPVGRR